MLETDSPYRGMRPAPRIMQNALDQAFESYVADFEKALLQDIFAGVHLKSVATSWDGLFSAVLILLAVIEKDIWRLVY